MKKIKITEKQAKLIGLKNITEDNQGSKSLKESKKNTIKISKEQYDRLFVSGLINESTVTGGLGRVDKTFKKEFSGKNIQNLEEISVSEDVFNIQKPNPSIPKTTQKFGKTIMEGGDDELKKETIELIKYLYRKTDEFSPYWEENGLTYDDICDSFESKNIVVSNNGKYELSKSLGTPEQAIQTVEDELRSLIGSKPKEEIEEGDWFDSSSDNPANQPEPRYSKASIKPNQLSFDGLYSNNEIAILKDKSGQLYSLYHDNVPEEELNTIANELGFAEESYIGKDEDGMPDFEYYYDWKGNQDQEPTVLAAYANTIANEAGKGVEDWENGVELVKIDDNLKQELLSLYDKDKNVVKLLGNVSESETETEGDRMARLKASIDKKRGEYKQWEDEFFRKRDLKNAIDSANAEEKMKLQNRPEPTPEPTPEPKQATGQYDIFGGIDETGCEGSSGAFAGGISFGDDAEVIKKDMPDVPVIAEMGDGGNFGYDTPGGLTMDLGKNNPKTKAEKVPQYAGGSFVKQPACSKLDNNKIAQSGGCNQGAGSVKIIKAKGSINAPSLAENKIFEAIAKKTGKTIEEVRQIINVKKSKA